MIIFIHGEDTFRSQRYLREQIARFKATRDPAGYNTIVFNAKETEPGKIMAEILSVPFLAERRMIVVKNLLSLSDKPFLQSLMARIEENRLPETTVLMLWQGDNLSKIKEVKELAGKLSNLQFTQKFSMLKGPDLEKWIEQEARSRGGTLGPRTREKLALLNLEMSELSNAIDQMIAYANKQPITEAMIDLFAVATTNDTTFSLVDAIMAQDTKRAMKLLTERRKAGDEDGQIFGLIVWNARLLLELADFGTRNPGATSDQAAKEIGIHPFVAKKNWMLAKKSSTSQLRNLYGKLVESDRRFKNGITGLPLTIELLTAR